jgi:hypothetical protein
MERLLQFASPAHGSSATDFFRGIRLVATQSFDSRYASPGPLQPGYAALTTDRATLVMWFKLRSPELAEDFERLMAGDRDIVRGSLDTVLDWRLTRPLDVPGQSGEAADYVLIAEIVEVKRWEEQASDLVQHLADDLARLVSSRGMLVVEHVL